MTTRNRNNSNTQRLLESAIMIGIATVLNEFFAFKAFWSFGGSVTLGSMIPLVFIAWRWGAGHGLFTAAVFALLQMIIGVKNVTYGQNAFQVISIALLDYILAYTVIGLAGIFRGRFKNNLVELGSGIVLACALRFGCHFFSGWLIWDALWPNSQNLSGPVYSWVYNSGYMLPETLIAFVIGLLLFVPLKRYFLGEDIKQA
ncbi:MAG: energy-coupled thiamine transporter ThiT [Clostridiales bacterium]|nr:energy-coupled thiamine transporter ThiT [Clostridiales bacterium]